MSRRDTRPRKFRVGRHAGQTSDRRTARTEHTGKYATARDIQERIVQANAVHRTKLTATSPRGAGNRSSRGW